MKTVTAKELRANLATILARVNAGEEIIVTHRFHEPILLKNVEPTKPKTKTTLAPGVVAYMKASKKPHNLDPNKSFKELYHEMLDEKYGL